MAPELQSHNPTASVAQQSCRGMWRAAACQARTCTCGCRRSELADQCLSADFGTGDPSRASGPIARAYSCPRCSFSAGQVEGRGRWAASRRTPQRGVGAGALAAHGPRRGARRAPAPRPRRSSSRAGLAVRDAAPFGELDSRVGARALHRPSHVLLTPEYACCDCIHSAICYWNRFIMHAPWQPTCAC